MTRLTCLLVLLLSPLQLQTGGHGGGHLDAGLGAGLETTSAGIASERRSERDRLLSSDAAESSPFVRTGANLPTLKGADGPLRIGSGRSGSESAADIRPPQVICSFHMDPFRSGSRSNLVSPTCENLPYDATAPPGFS